MYIRLGCYNWSKYRLMIGFLVVIGLIVLLLLNINCANEKYCISSKLNRLPSNNEIDENILDVYRKQIPQRQQYLLQVPESNDYSVLYNTLVPEVFCRNLVRIGFIGDGGKWICNPLNVQSSHECVVYSLGIRDDPSFEEEFQRFTGNKCLLRSFDKDAQNSSTIQRISAANGKFMKALIAGKTNELMNHFTFKDIMNRFGDKRVDILKIDIEGAEFDIQDELISVPICQILIEIHGKTSKEALQLLQKFSTSGFYLFSYEINGFNHECAEYGFIHQDCFKNYDIKTIYGKYLS
uniref:Methyltransferase domain-containing protein n=1 Tax=Panagrolaimus sp. PS1159 TaxID=55785 RepID=A0AC35FSE3_9BILA